MDHSPNCPSSATAGQPGRSSRQREQHRPFGQSRASQQLRRLSLWTRPPQWNHQCELPNQSWPHPRPSAKCLARFGSAKSGTRNYLRTSRWGRRFPSSSPSLFCRPGRGWDIKCRGINGREQVDLECDVSDQLKPSDLIIFPSLADSAPGL